MRFQDGDIKLTTFTPEEMSNFKTADGGQAPMAVIETPDHHYVVMASAPAADAKKDATKKDAP
jgi:hypothetical protein